MITLHFHRPHFLSDYICLWCNDRGRTFYSLDAVRKHMNDKGHCKMLHEGLALAEYSEFYDYSSSYPDNVSVKLYPWTPIVTETIN